MKAQDDGIVTLFVILAQVCVVGFLLGMLSFAAIVVLLIPPRQDELPMIITYIAAGATFLSVTLAAFAAVLMKRAGGSTALSGKSRGPLVLYFFSVLLSCSLLLGAGFFNLIAYLLEGSMISLIITAGIVGVMLLQFPTKGKYASWMTQKENDATES